MKTMIKIALLSVVVIGLSFPAYAAEVTNEAGVAITIDGTNSGANLSFTPSANTLLAYDVSATTYIIASASSKTNSDNGVMYGMTEAFSGYYQTQGGGESPDTTAVTGWTAMGGTAAAEAEGEE